MTIVFDVSSCAAIATVHDDTHTLHSRIYLENVEKQYTIGVMISLSQFFTRHTYLFMQALYFNTLVTMFTLPFLICWGLPLSLTAPIGNILFAPFLMILITLSGLLMILHFFGIPAHWCCTLLNSTTYVWMKLLDQAPSWALFGFSLKTLPLWLLVSALTLITLCNTTMKHQEKFSYILLGIFTGTLVTICMQYTVHEHKTLYYRNTPIIITSHRGNTIIDASRCTSFPNASWTEYTLLPTLIKYTGATHISTLVIPTLKRKTLNTLQNTLALLIPIDQTVSVKKRAFSNLLLRNYRALH